MIQPQTPTCARSFCFRVHNRGKKKHKLRATLLTARVTTERNALHNRGQEEWFLPHKERPVEQNLSHWRLRLQEQRESVQCWKTRRETFCSLTVRPALLVEEGVLPDLWWRCLLQVMGTQSSTTTDVWTYVFDVWETPWIVVTRKTVLISWLLQTKKTWTRRKKTELNYSYTFFFYICYMRI